MISLDDLRYFKEISRTGNLRRAGERLGVSQPALSHSLKRLELQLGCHLFIRSKSGVRLTKAGIRFSSLANKLEDDWRQIHSLVSEEMHSIEGTYTLGCHSTIGVFTLHKFLGNLLADHPKLNFRLEHGLSRELAEGVISNRIDFGIIANPPKHPDLVIKNLCHDRVRLWKSNHLQNEGVLICDPNLHQVQKIIRAFPKYGIQFKREIHSSSLELIAKMIVGGIGVGILPTRVLNEFGIDECSPFLVPSPEVEDSICLVYKKENQKTAAAKAILQAVLSPEY